MILTTHKMSHFWGFLSEEFHEENWQLMELLRG